MLVAGDLVGCEDLAVHVVEVNTCMLPLYEGIEAVLASKVSQDTNWTRQASLAEVVNSHLKSVDAVEIVNENPWLSQLGAFKEPSPVVFDHTSAVFDLSNMASTTSWHPNDIEHGIEHGKSDVGVEPVDGGIEHDKFEQSSHGIEIPEHITPNEDSSMFQICACSALVLCLVTVWVVLATISSTSYFDVVKHDMAAGQCQSQNYLQLVTSWLVRDLLSNVGRSKQLLVTTSTTAGFSGRALSGTFAEAIMSMMNASNPVVGRHGSLFTAWKQQGHVFSSEYDESKMPTPIAHLYRHDTGLCWEAPYSSSAGYGTWVQTTTGPLATPCAAVTTAAWYIAATSLSNGANSTVTGTISSGYIGITHMLHERTLDVVFGGEMDGRTLSTNLNHGKPVQGEIYVVSAAESSNTLVAATESTVESQLHSSLRVDPTSVGHLTGSSASSLELSFGSFSQMWSRSLNVPLADSYGQVAVRCPSSKSGAYVAIGAGDSVYSSIQSSSLQRFQTDTSLQLLLVNLCAQCSCISLDLVSFFGNRRWLHWQKAATPTSSTIVLLPPSWELHFAVPYWLRFSFILLSTHVIPLEPATMCL